MKPVRGTVVHDPENGTRGDCERACIASLLELPIQLVPHFFDYEPSIGGAKGLEAKKKFLDTLGLKWADVPFQAADLAQLLRATAQHMPGVYHTLTGLSHGGVGHTVVCYNGEIVHDPTYGAEHGIVGPMPDSESDQEYYWIGILTFNPTEEWYQPIPYSDHTGHRIDQLLLKNGVKLR